MPMPHSATRVIRLPLAGRAAGSGSHVDWVRCLVSPLQLFLVRRSAAVTMGLGIRDDSGEPPHCRVAFADRPRLRCGLPAGPPRRMRSW